MRAALLLCPSWDLEQPTLGVALLSAYAARRGHETRLFDLNKDFALHCAGLASTEKSPMDAGELWLHRDFVESRVAAAFEGYFDRCLGRVLDDRPGLVGFSVFDTNRFMSLALARRLKEMRPDLPVAFGGPTCFKPEHARDLVASPGVDFVVVGEADEAFPALLDALEAGEDPAAVPGVLTEPRRDEAGRLALFPPAEINDAPVPDFGGYRLADYESRCLTVETSRGCVRRCVFCNDWRRWNKFRQKRADRIAEEMRSLLGRHPEARGFLFSDSILNGDMRQLGLLADTLLRDGVRTRWRGYAIVRPEMTPPALDKLRASGCAELMYGVETGSEKVGRSMGKNVTTALNSRVVRDTHVAGISVLVFIMVGFPGETEEDFRRTLDFVRANAASIGTLHVSLCSVGDMMDVLDDFDVLHTGHDSFWINRDFSNHYLVRLDRFRRVWRLAADCGIRTISHRHTDPATIDAYCESLRGYYRSYWSDHLDQLFPAGRAVPA